MKQLLYILTIVFLASCSNNTDNGKTKISNEHTELIIGERIDGPANIRDTVNGKIIFTLNDNVLVETSPQQENWQLIGLSVALTEKQLEDFKIYPNSDLVSIDGRIIGKTKDTVNVYMEEEKSGLICAYTHIDNIKTKTIPEKALENEIKKGNLTLKTLKQYLTAFNFIDEGENEKLKYVLLFIYESTIIDPSPLDRITLLFDKNDNLIGVIHSRPLKLKNYKNYELIRGHTLTIFANLDEIEIKRIINERIKFYNSVD